MVIDAFDILTYAFSAWLYVFSPRYRASVHKEWREAATWEKWLLVLQFTISAVLGVGVPALVAWWIIDGQLF